MRVRSASVVAGSLFAVAAAVVACSSGSSSNSVSGGPADTAGQFADQYCALIAPCCADAGLSSNGAACHAWITIAEQQGTYNPTAGNACLGAMQQAQSQPDFCTTFGGNPSSCNQVFKGSSGGTVQPGGACMQDSDCAAAPGGSATCFTQFNLVDGGSNETRTCVQTTTGKAGETPCIGDVNGDITEYSWQGPPPDHGVLCDAAQGLYCDATTHACVAFKSAGAACTGDTECGPDAYCSFQSGGGACTARVAAGSSCAGGVQCDASSYCDPATQKCIAALASGSACSTSEQCQSKACVNGKCSGSSNLGLSLLCGAGN